MNTHRNVDRGTAWVVGASAGIGAKTARELSRRGAIVAVTARRREALDEVSAGRMSVVPADVTDRDQVQAAWRQVTSAVGVPDLVVVSAGYWKQTPPGTFDADELRRHVEINLLGLGEVLGLVVPAMVERGSGTIAVVASVAGYRGLPGGDYYGATKAAQINLLEALRGSLAPRGVRVVTVCPGFVETDMTQGNTFPMPFMISADRAAREICDGLDSGRHEITFPTPMRLGMKAARLLPVRIWSAITARTARRSG